MVTGGMRHTSLGKVSDGDMGQYTHPQNYRIRSVSLKVFLTGQVHPPSSDKGTNLALFTSD